MNKRERQASRHQGSIDGFTLSANSQIVSGYVAGGERKATNIMFCGLFMVFILAMIALSIVGFTKGNYKALIAGVDSNNRICGYNDEVKDYPNTYYFLNKVDNSLKPTCVKSCPASADDPIDCMPTTATPTCTPVAGSGYSTTDFLGYCVPKDIDEFGQIAKSRYDKLMQN